MANERSAQEIMAEMAARRAREGEMGVQSRASIQQDVAPAIREGVLPEGGGMSDGRPLVDPRISNKHQSPV
jgi:hypothetical protein